MRAWWPAREFAQPGRPAPERWVERLRVFVLQAPPSSAAQARAMPITASPALGSPRKSLQNVTHSYFGPAAEEIAIEPGQFDRFGVISSRSLRKRLNGFEIEDHAAGAGIPYHAPGPEKRR